MPACARCGGRICKGETSCFNCQMPVDDVKSTRDVNLGRFRAVVGILFWLCTALTVASIVFDIGFKTAMTGAAAVILHFVRVSAGEMSESKS